MSCTLAINLMPLDPSPSPDGEGMDRISAATTTTCKMSHVGYYNHLGTTSPISTLYRPISHRLCFLLFISFNCY